MRLDHKRKQALIKKLSEAKVDEEVADEENLEESANLATKIREMTISQGGTKNKNNNQAKRGLPRLVRSKSPVIKGSPKKIGLP